MELAIAGSFIVENPGVDGRLGSRHREQELLCTTAVIVQAQDDISSLLSLGLLMMLFMVSRVLGRPSNDPLQQLRSTIPLRSVVPNYFYFIFLFSRSCEYTMVPQQALMFLISVVT